MWCSYRYTNRSGSVERIVSHVGESGKLVESNVCFVTGAGVPNLDAVLRSTYYVVKAVRRRTQRLVVACGVCFTLSWCARVAAAAMHPGQPPHRLSLSLCCIYKYKKKKYHTGMYSYGSGQSYILEKKTLSMCVLSTCIAVPSPRLQESRLLLLSYLTTRRGLRGLSAGLRSIRGGKCSMRHQPVRIW